jgi:hypothetical protein
LQATHSGTWQQWVLSVIPSPVLIWPYISRDAPDTFVAGYPAGRISG